MGAGMQKAVQKFLSEETFQGDLEVENDQLGCRHYMRKCKLRAPCCDRIFTCHRCHDEAANSPERHKLVRTDVTQVVCSLCDTEQEVAQFCSNCKACMGKYFCHICKFYDDDTWKRHFHCDDCGICRVGGRANFYHCQTCAACLETSLRGAHPCVQGATQGDCPICLEELFDSTKPIHMIRNCGHTMHRACFDDIIDKNGYKCPSCSRSMIDMTDVWAGMDQEVLTTAPTNFYLVQIHCNDCNQPNTVMFHQVGLKCLTCGSYNTSSL